MGQGWEHLAAISPTREAQIMDEWEQIINDPEFNGQPGSIRAEVATNYFKRNINSDPSFKSQSDEIKSLVKRNFYTTLQRPAEKVPMLSMPSPTLDMQPSNIFPGTDVPSPGRPMYPVKLNLPTDPVDRFIDVAGQKIEIQKAGEYLQAQRKEVKSLQDVA